MKKTVYLLSALLALILFSKDSSYSADAVFVDDYVSAEAPIDAQSIAAANVDFNDTRNSSIILYNPAMLSQLLCHSFSFNQTAMILNGSYSSLFYTRPFYKGGIGFGYLSMGLDNKLFVETDELGFILKPNFNIEQKAIIAGYGQPIKLFRKKMNFGAAFRMLSYSIGSSSLSGFSLMTSINHRIFNKISVTHSLSNIIGGSIGSDKLPIRIRNGAVFQVFDKIFIAPEIEIVQSRLDYRVGFKYSPMRYLTLFSGYQPNRMSLGFGIYFSDFILNYSFQTNSNKVKSEAVSTFGFSWNLGYNRKLRLNRYKDDKRFIDQYMKADAYDSAILLLEPLKTVLDKKKDEDEYSNIIALIEQINNSRSMRQKMEENNLKTLRESLSARDPDPVAL